MKTKLLSRITSTLAVGLLGLTNTSTVLADDKLDLEKLAIKLEKAAAAGKISEEEAKAEYEAAVAKVASESEGSGASNGRVLRGRDKRGTSDKDLDEFGASLKKAVANGELTKEEAIAKYEAAAAKSKKKPEEEKKGKSEDPRMELVWTLLQAVESDTLTADEAMTKYKYALDGKGEKKGGNGKPAQDMEKLEELSKTLPTSSTAGDKEGPGSTFIFGWAADATHRFMDNSHTGKSRKISGLSFRLDHRDHNAIGRTWENVRVSVAHGDWSSLKYNKSTAYELVDEPVKVFDKQWGFPALRGRPPLEPASWGGPQNSLSFRFEEPFEYNGKDAIYVEFKFSGGTAEKRPGMERGTTRGIRVLPRLDARSRWMERTRYRRTQRRDLHRACPRGDSNFLYSWWPIGLDFVSQRPAFYQVGG